jgi:hypothetical protein
MGQQKVRPAHYPALRGDEHPDAEFQRRKSSDQRTKEIRSEMKQDQSDKARV